MGGPGAGGSWPQQPVQTSPHPAGFIEPVVRKAHAMLQSRAYVHQYQREGMEVFQFEEALMKVEETLERYKLLSEC